MTSMEKKKRLKKRFPDKDYWLSYITRMEFFSSLLLMAVLNDFFNELIEFLFSR